MAELGGGVSTGERSDPEDAPLVARQDRESIRRPGSASLDEGKASVVIAVLDDGVDIDHPNLVSRVAAGPGRDFNFLPSEPDHSNPRPKIQEED